MKSLIFILLFLSSYYIINGQVIPVPVNRAGPANTVQDANLFALRSFRPAVYSDTLQANSQYLTLDSAGKMIFTYDINGLWVRQFNPKRWVQVSGDGVAAGTVTNFLSGNLSPLFTTTVTNSTTVPDLSFSLSNASPYTLFGRGSGTGVPSYISSIDSNWIPSLHSSGYYDGRFVHLTGDETITGIKTFASKQLNLTTASSSVTSDGIFMRILDTRTTGNYRLSGISFGTNNAFQGQLLSAYSAPVSPFNGTNGIYLRNYDPNMGTYFTNTNNASVELKSFSLTTLDVGIGYAHTLGGGSGVDSAWPAGNTYHGRPVVIGYRAEGPGVAVGYRAAATNDEATAIGPQARASGLATIAIGDGTWALPSGAKGNQIVMGDGMWAYGNLNFLSGGGAGTAYDRIIGVGVQGYSVNRDDEIASADGQMYMAWYNPTNPVFDNTGYINDFFWGPRTADTLYSRSFYQTNASGNNQNGTSTTHHGSFGTGTGTGGYEYWTTSSPTSSGSTLQFPDTVLALGPNGAVGINTTSPIIPFSVYEKGGTVKIAGVKNTAFSIIEVYGKTTASAAVNVMYDGQDVSNSAFVGIGIDNGSTALGSAGGVIVSGRVGTGVRKKLTIGGYSDVVSFFTPWQVFDTTGFIGLAGYTTPTTWLDLRNSTGSGIQRAANFLLGPAGNGNGVNIGMGTTAAVLGTIGMVQSATNSGYMPFSTSNSASLTEKWRIASTGQFSNTLATGTAYIELKAATATAGTGQIKLAEGLAQTTPENGTINYVSDNLQFVETSTVYILAKTLTNTATLDFPNTSASSSSDLTITVAGVVTGQPVSIGVVNGSIVSNTIYTAWVSANNTVTVRFSNLDISNAADPASGTFRVSVNVY